ncbi:MAG: transglycosylase domain-containing protein [Holophagaceae bacterium]|nr:transglycosylase domain-containing protein [Holophagaceae bacterium]
MASSRRSSSPANWRRPTRRSRSSGPTPTRSTSAAAASIEAAAQYYFGKSAPQLNVEECALLGLVQNPSWYHPYNPDPEVQARR